MRELIEAQLDATSRTIDQRFAGFEKELELRADERNEKFRELQTKQADMERLRDEKFNGVAKQFALVEQQRIEQKADTKLAVDAALSAQVKAVEQQTVASERSIAKSETATSKQLEQLGTTFSTAFEGFRREIADIKERVTTVEQLKLGAQGANTGLYAVAGFIVAVIIIAATLAAAIH